MDPDQTAPTGAVWSGSTLFNYGSSNSLVDDENIHYVIMRFLRVNNCEFSVLQLGFSWNARTIVRLKKLINSLPNYK